VPLDVLSVLLSALAFGGLLYALSAVGEGSSSHEQAVSPLVPAVIGGIALVLFVLRQVRLARVSTPLLDLRTFRTPNFTFAIVLIALASLSLFGSLIVLPIYMQTVLGLSTLTTGLLLLPGGLAMGLLAPIVGRLYDRVGPRPLLPVGALIISIALWAMTVVLSADTPAFMIPIMHVLLFTGLAFTFTPLFSAGLGALRPDLYSHGAAILNTVQQVMGGAGTALFVTLMAATAAGPLAAGASVAVANAAGVHMAFMAGAIISLAGIIVSFFVRRPPETEGAEPVMAH
jgi:DHA2 family lincomycin resistance protein-like MFS transporter